MKPLRTALIQNSASTDVAANLAAIDEWCDPINGSDLLVLPEVFAYRGDDDGYRRIAEPLDGVVSSFASKLARKKNAWVLAGSIIERADEGIYNTSVLFDRSGSKAASYRKIHLFEAHLENGKTIREADAYSAGIAPVMADLDGWNVGLSICYDLRFPELYRHYSSHGADLLFVPANFTQRTGKDHWEVLIRARAVENQCFVVAPNQCGINTTNDVVSYGHSMAVGPWGTVLCEAGDSPAVIETEFDPSLIRETRARVPALEHRKM